MTATESKDAGDASERVGVNETLDLAWQELCHHLMEASKTITRDEAAGDPALRAAGYRYLLNLLNAGLEQMVFSADPEYPETGRLQDPTKRYATESPDCFFGYTVLDPEGTYRLTGTGGSAHFVGLTLYREMKLHRQLLDNPDADYETIFAQATGSTLAALSHPGSLAFDDDGNFEVILSAEPHEGNWLPLTPEVSHILTRQYFYDWDTEQKYHISVERLDAVGTGPVATPPAVSRQLLDVGDFVNGHAVYWAKMYELGTKAKHNLLRTQPALQASYAGDGGYIAYGSGFVELAPDEVAIIEVTPPDCHFWNIQLGDYWGQSLDYTFRQSSLNGHQAALDDDGVFHAVVSDRDPGIANWLDTAGNRLIRVTYRWWLCTGPDVPDPKLRIVKYADLGQELSASVPTVTAQERRDSLDRRRRAVLRRYDR